MGWSDKIWEEVFLGKKQAFIRQEKSCPQWASVHKRRRKRLELAPRVAFKALRAEGQTPQLSVSVSTAGHCFQEKAGFVHLSRLSFTW